MLGKLPTYTVIKGKSFEEKSNLLQSNTLAVAGETNWAKGRGIYHTCEEA